MSSPENASVPARRANVKGHTSVRAKALMSVAAYATAEILRVKPSLVEVSVHDDNALLGFVVKTPINRDDLHRCWSADGGTVFDFCDGVRDRIRKRTAEVSGHAVGQIHVILNGVYCGHKKGAKGV